MCLQSMSRVWGWRGPWQRGKGVQEHDGEVGVQHGRHQQRFHWHPGLPDRREQDHHNQSNQVRHDLRLFHRHCWWLENIAREFWGQPAGHLANSDVYPASSVVLQVSRCEKRAVTYYLHCAESPSYLYYPECSQCITYTSIFLRNLCELTYTGNILWNMCVPFWWCQLVGAIRITLWNL